MLKSNSQNVEIGGWRDYLPYNDAVGVGQNGWKNICGNRNSLFYLDVEEET